MTTLTQIQAAAAEIEPALIRHFERHGLVFFTWASAPVVGGQCGECHTIVWTNPRHDPVLSETKPEDVPDHGSGYRAYYEENLQRFLLQLPPCPHCKATHYNRFINNVRWCRFADGTELPEETSSEQLIAQDANLVLVWICIH